MLSEELLRSIKDDRDREIRERLRIHEARRAARAMAASRADVSARPSTTPRVDPGMGVARAADCR